MITKEKYNSWNILKQNINFWKNENKYPKPWEIWYLNVWLNIWSESSWKGIFFKRPVLIIKKLWNLFLTISMTTKWKNNNKFYYKIDDCYFEKESYLILSQAKSVDKKRFILKIWELTHKDFYKIKKELKSFWF